MNIKTLQRKAKKQGLSVKQEYDETLEETVYTVTDEDGIEIAQTNSKKYLIDYLLERAAV